MEFVLPDPAECWIRYFSADFIEKAVYNVELVEARENQFFRIAQNMRHGLFLFRFAIVHHGEVGDKVGNYILAQYALP